MSQEAYLKSLTPIERERYYQDNACGATDGKYMMPLTPDEIQFAKDKNINNAMKLGDFQDELDKIKAEYKGKMEPLSIENKILLNEIRSGQRLAQGTLYDMQNFPDGIMETYNDQGDFVSSRKLLPSEKQGMLTQMRKAQ